MTFLLIGLILGGTADDDAIAALALAKAARGRTVTVAVPAVAVKSGYPLRPQSEWFFITRGRVREYQNWTHLTKGEHAGKFPVDWLQSLTWEEIQALHADDHQGIVKWDYIPGGKPSARPRGVSSFSQPAAWCPPGSRT